MSVFQKRDLGLRRSEPRVWIGKLALFECIDPITPIRDPIKFHTGLNIVWGVENEAMEVAGGDLLLFLSLVRDVDLVAGEENVGVRPFGSNLPFGRPRLAARRSGRKTKQS